MALKISIMIILSSFLAYVLFANEEDHRTLSEESVEVTQDAEKNVVSALHPEPSRGGDPARTSHTSSTLKQRSQPTNSSKLNANESTNTVSAKEQKDALKRTLGIDSEEEGAPKEQGVSEAEAEVETEAEKVIFSVDREGIHGAIQEISGDVMECYESWLKENEALKGRVQVSFVIDHTEGEVDESGQTQEALEATLRDVYLTVDEVKHPMISGCLINLIEGLHFENVSSKVTVRYPFKFNATR